MNLLDLYVSGNSLVLDSKPMTTSGSVNYDTCAFTFNKEWRGFERTAIFSIGDSEGYTVSLNDTSTCKIPKECLSKTGILRIGVVGKNEEGVVISTNIVTHRVVPGANDEELDLIDCLPDGTAPDVPSTDSNESAIGFMWANNRFSVPDDLVVDDYLNTDPEDIQTYYDVVFSELAEKYPDYVMRFNEFEDYDGNPIDAFVFTGTEYDRVIYITANHFGSSNITLAALGGFFRNLCENYKTDPNLNFLHSKVKFVVVPIVCPQAFLAQSRVNSNGYAPFVNYDHYWAESPIEDKGDAPFTEIETISVLNYMDMCGSENLIWMIDFESNGFTSNTKEIYYKANDAVQANFINKVVSKFNGAYVDGDKNVFTEIIETNAPIATNFATQAYNINAVTVIWSDKDYIGSMKNKETITYMDFIGNFLLETAKNSDIVCVDEAKPITKHIKWRSTGANDCFVTNSSMSPMWISAYAQDLYGVFNATLSGYVIVEASEETSVNIRPIMYQKKSLTEDYEHRFNDEAFDIEIKVPVGISAIPINSVIGCKHSSYIATQSSSLITVLAASSEKSVKIIGFSYTVNAIPSDGRNVIEVLSPSGKVSDYTSELDRPIFIVERPELYHDII